MTKHAHVGKCLMCARLALKARAIARAAAAAAVLAMPLACRAGTVLDITPASATIRVNTIFAPGGTPGLMISSSTLDLYAAGTLVAQVVNSPSQGGKLLLRNQTISEVPNLATFNNPLTGLTIHSAGALFVYNGTAMWSYGRNGAGLGILTGNAVTAKDTEDTNSPAIHNEVNHDGLMWIDNRLPDGVAGHDASGRFLRFKVGGARIFSVGAYGVQIATHTRALVSASTLTVNGRVESLVGGFKFPDGSVQTTAAGAGGNVHDFIVLTPLSIAPESPAVGTLYLDSTTGQARWWNGSQWLVAW